MNRKILILHPDRDEVQKEIVLKDRQRAFIVLGKALYISEPGQERLWFYLNAKERKRLLCKAHQDIVRKAMK